MVKPERKMMTWKIDASLLKAVKVECAKSGMFAYQFVEEALRDKLGKVKDAK